MFRTPFRQYHESHGARFVDFAGWEMPIMYRSIMAEHQQVRQSGGVFDVSHMGRINFKGRGARRLLERLLTRRISDMDDYQCRYAMICNEQGGVRDDVIVYRFEEHWMLVVNASNRKKILEHIKANTGDLQVDVEDITLTTAMVAVQGPKVMPLIGDVSDEIASLKRYRFCVKNLLTSRMIISRTGYTGEDGVEIILPANKAEEAIQIFLDEVDDTEQQVILPAGLGARDSLRLEAGMPLYGHELDEQTDPLSAGLGFAVSLDKGEADNEEPFIGQEALKKVRSEGPSRKLVGLQLEGKRTPRQGMAVMLNDQEIGKITSGCMSPTVEAPIAMAYLPAEHSSVGTTVDIDFGRKTQPARVVKLPFYKAK